MANQDFDMVVVNYLERPASVDIDRLQSQLYRTLRDLLAPSYAYGSAATVAEGFLANGFKAAVTTGLAVSLQAGFGFQHNTVDTPSNIDGVAGLDDLSAYKPLVLSQAKTVTLAAAPASGFCRRDIICVSWHRFVQESVVPIWASGSGVFAGAVRPKNVTFDLYDEGVEIVPFGTSPTTDSRVLVMQGQDTAYATEDSFLSATLATVPVGFLPVAVVNVGFGVTGITADRIVDYRTLLLPGGTAAAAMRVDVAEGQSSFPGSHYESAPVSGKVVIAGVKDLQELWIYIVLGDSSKWSPVSSNWAFLGQNASGPAVNVLPRAGAVQTVDLAIQAILAGTDTAFITANPTTVAVGQKVLAFRAVYGRETYQFPTATQLTTGDGQWAGIAVGDTRANWQDTNPVLPPSDATGGATTLGAPGTIDSVSIAGATASGGLIKSINQLKLDSAALRAVCASFTLQRI